jgi:hypothetical protein
MNAIQTGTPSGREGGGTGREGRPIFGKLLQEPFDPLREDRKAV